jgi:hypothetical protein
VCSSYVSHCLVFMLLCVFLYHTVSRDVLSCERQQERRQGRRQGEARRNTSGDKVGVEEINKVNMRATRREKKRGDVRSGPGNKRKEERNTRWRRLFRGGRNIHVTGGCFDMHLPMCGVVA